MGLDKHPLNPGHNSVYGPISNLSVPENVCPEHALFERIVDDFEVTIHIIQCSPTYFPFGLPAWQLLHRF